MQYRLLPRFLQIELTYGCNSSCVFCYNPTHKKQPDDQLRFDIIDKVNSYKIRHVQLIGGEVTLLEKLPEFLGRLEDVPWKSIVTNGRIIRRDIIGLVDEVYLSLHGDKIFHERITKARDSFDSILEAIRCYVRAGIKVHSDTVLTSQNYDQVFEIAQVAQDMGMESMFLNIFQPAGIGSRKSDDLSPSLDQIRNAIDQIVRARDELGFSIRFGTSTPYCLDERLVTEGLGFRCGVGDWFASISPLGEFRTCNQSTKSYGNIISTPLHEIWHSKIINTEYRSLEWLPDLCKPCVFRDECHGGCRVSDQGQYRLDLTVERDRDRIVQPQRLAALKQAVSAA